MKKHNSFEKQLKNWHIVWQAKFKKWHAKLKNWHPFATLARLLARWHIKMRSWHAFGTLVRWHVSTWASTPRWHVWHAWHAIQQTLQKLNKAVGFFNKIKYFHNELDKVSRKLKTNLKILQIYSNRSCVKMEPIINFYVILIFFYTPPFF